MYICIFMHIKYICSYMNHFSVQGKLTQHCKSATLLFLKKKKTDKQNKTNAPFSAYKVHLLPEQYHLSIHQVSKRTSRM